MSFCRITGKARNLPKPNFFPIIPAVAPGDARVMCRITTKRMDYHNYVPVIESGKRPDSVKTLLAQNKENVSVNLISDGNSESEGKGPRSAFGNHANRPDFKYVEPILRSDAVDKGDLKAFEDLQRLLKGHKKTLKPEDADKKFVYLMRSMLCGLVVPAAVEEAIRQGDLESLSISKGCDKAIFKMKGKPTLFLSLREVDMTQGFPGSGLNGVDSEGSGGKVFFDGCGQNKETLNKQKQVLENKKKKTFTNKKIFEDLERQAEEQFQKDLERSSARGESKAEIEKKRIRQAKKYRKSIQEFQDTHLPACNMAPHGQWETAFKANIHQLDWKRIEGMPEKLLAEMVVPLKARKITSLTERSLKSKRREKNVFIPDQPGLELVPLESDDLKALDPKLSHELLDFVAGSKEDGCSVNSSLRSMFANGEEALKSLPTLAEFEAIGEFLKQGKSYRMGCLYDHGDGGKFASDPSQAPSGSNVIIGAIIEVAPDLFKFLPAEQVRQKNGTMLLVPGQKMAAAGGEFIPGASLKGEEPGQFKFIPGLFTTATGKDGAEASQFLAGQLITRPNGGVDFVSGQVVHTQNGAKFVEGQTISSPDGLKFVACSALSTEDGTKLVPGTVIDMGPEQSQFVPGQMLGGNTLEDCTFVPGQMGEVDGERTFIPGQIINGEFVPGQMVKLDGNQSIFVPGQKITNKLGAAEFVCGIFNQDGRFTPGMTLDSLDGPVFVEGRLCSHEGKTVFVPGKIANNDDSAALAKGQARFEKAQDVAHISMKSSSVTESGSLVLDGSSLALAFKKMRPQKGKMVQTQGGPKFVLESEPMPVDLVEGSETVPGRLECGEDGPVFIPGKSMELNGIKTFIPGKMVDNGDGTETFMPGKVVQTKNGPKFVSGQVIQTEEGEKFLPGIVMDSPEGKIFVPAMEIQTKTGPLLIPGQVICTDNGLKFVPGDIVATEKGALFVPGLVIDSPDGAKFIHGEVIETPDGPRVLPPDVRGDGNMEYCVQGFDINIEEARLLLGKSKSSGEVSDLLGGVGGAVVSPEALKALAEGFDCVKSNVIPTMGAEGDVDKLLNDELLDAYDSPAVRKIIKSVFIAVFAELCAKVDEVQQATEVYINGTLSANIKHTLLSKMKLNPALEKLKGIFEAKNVGETEANEILNLIAGIITCSIPGALKECSLDGTKKGIKEEEFKTALLECIEESIQSILEEDGVISQGLFNDMQELVKLAKDLEFDENQSFFSKVAAVTEGRCNSKFVDKLLTQLAEKDGISKINSDEIMTKLVTVLGSKIELQDAFKEMSEKNPEFIKEVLEHLSHEDSHSTNGNTVELLQNAIVKTVEDNCQKQLDVLIDQLQHAGEKGELTDEDIKSMLKQAMGLAKFMRRQNVVDQLSELLKDPEMIGAIKDDPMTRDILRKLLVLRKLAGKDRKKKNKLDQLEHYNSDSAREDDSLKEFVNQSKVLTSSPGRAGKLHKSKSMIKKSKSVIMTAKDIPMNAFMAMKNTSSQKDEKWLQNFLAESVMEDIPWECSKALVILKEGLQAIIPREASRSILLGDASYTLIDDNGVEFYLSAADKKRRENGQTEESEPKMKTMRELLQSDPDYKGQFSVSKTDKMRGTSSINSQPTEDLLNLHGRKGNNLGSISYRGRGSKSPSPIGAEIRPPKPNVNFRMETDAEIMNSLEKYRPKNHQLSGGPDLDSGPPTADFSNINDLRDYYAGLRTHQRAMRRLSLLNGGQGRHNDDEGDEGEHFETFQPRSQPSRRKYSQDSFQPSTNSRSFLTRPQIGANPPDDYEDNHSYEPTFNRPAPSLHSHDYVDNEECNQPRNGFNGHQAEMYAPRKPIATEEAPEASNSAYDMSSLDDSTRQILDRARNIRSKPIWEKVTHNGGKRNTQEEISGPARKVYNWEEDKFEYVPDREGPGPSKAQDDTMLSSKTRNMLDSLKKSTMVLEGLNQQSEDVYAKPFGRGGEEQPARRPKKPSRFLRSSSAMEAPSEPIRAPSIEPTRSRYAASPSPPRQNRPFSSMMGLADDILSSRSEGRYSSRAPDEDRYDGGYSRYPAREREERGYSRQAKDYRGRRGTQSPDNDYRQPSRNYAQTRYGDSPEPPKARSKGKGASYSRGRDDDDDFDSMIADLKKKTSGRDMLRYVSQIEGRDVTPPRRYEQGGRSGSRYEAEEPYDPPPRSTRRYDEDKFEPPPRETRKYSQPKKKPPPRNEYSDDEDEREYERRPTKPAGYGRRAAPRYDDDD